MTGLLMAVPVLAPLLAAACALSIGWRRLSGWVNVLAALIITADGVALAARVGTGHIVGDANIFRADAVTTVMLLVIGSVGTLATCASIPYLNEELVEGHTTKNGARLYAVLMPIFLAAMSLTVMANNLGVTWTGIEATTIATAFLVGHKRTRESLEATWKYVVICSFGITLAFLGTVVLYFASIHAGATPTNALNLDTLASRAQHMNPSVTRLAIGLLLIGFGTKVGLFPFHTWLADAHSQAPAPVSALMSGVLLSVAFSVILRVRVIADAALGKEFMREGLVIIGLSTLLVAVSLLVAQRDLKRMLAYSSLEQMGLIAVAAGAGTPLAITGILLLMMAHGIAKAILFITAGQLQHAHHSSEIADISAILTRSPMLGSVFAIGIIGLLGLPPFGLFPSELAIARGMAQAHIDITLVITVGLLFVGFTSIARHGTSMLLGPAQPSAPSLRSSPLITASLLSAVVLFIALGVSLGSLSHLLTDASSILVGPR